jgi:crotonobetainyl-CoA:carnitine CoA-transferase CaiB-like acyl-CoA transferase
MSGAAAIAGNEIPGSESHLLNGGTFYDYYQTSDNRYFSVGSLEPKFFNGLCDLFELPQLKPLANKSGAQQQIKDCFSDAFKQKTFAQWQTLFIEVDLCVEPVLNLAEASEHPQIVARNMVVDVPHQLLGSQKQIGCPIKFSNYQPSYGQAGGDIGRDTEQVLNQLAISEQLIDTLSKNGVVTL